MLLHNKDVIIYYIIWSTKNPILLDAFVRRYSDELSIHNRVMIGCVCIMYSLSYSEARDPSQFDILSSRAVRTDGRTDVDGDGRTGQSRTYRRGRRWITGRPDVPRNGRILAATGKCLDVHTGERRRRAFFFIPANAIRRRPSLISDEPHPDIALITGHRRCFFLLQRVRATRGGAARCAVRRTREPPKPLTPDERIRMHAK